MYIHRLDDDEKFHVISESLAESAVKREVITSPDMARNSNSWAVYNTADINSLLIRPMLLLLAANTEDEL